MIDKGRFVVRSGVKESCRWSRKAPSVSRSPLPPGDPTHPVKRELIFLGERYALLKESRETTKEHARAGSYLCADVLCLTLQTTTERPEFSLGLSEFGARARPPGDPSPPPQPHPVVRAGPHRAYGGLSRAATAFPSPRVRLISPLLSLLTARENSCERSLLYGEGGPATRRRV